MLTGQRVYNSMFDQSELRPILFDADEFSSPESEDESDSHINDFNDFTKFLGRNKQQMKT
jgi:hypothetical protein